MDDHEKASLPAFRYPVAELLKELGGTAAPGAMGASALLGAVAAALVAKVGRQTLGKEGYEPVAEEMQRVANRAEALGELLQAAVDQDDQARNRINQALGLPSGTPEEQEIRRGCHQLALKNLAQVCHSLAGNVAEVAQLAETVLRYGLAASQPEGVLAARTALTAGRGLVAVAGQVLPTLPDLSWAEQHREKLAEASARFDDLDAELAELVSGRPALAQPTTVTLA